MRSYLVDALAGALLLRGTNVSGEAKQAPDRLVGLNAADVEYLRDDLGLCAIRLLVFWEAIEPEPGRFDEVYLAAIRERVRVATAGGLHVVVDMHQDLFGRAFGHAGAPKWAVAAGLAESFVAPTPWMLGYLTPQVAAAFDRLYDDPELRGSFVRAWARLARALAGAGVLAYDLLNEPGWGTRSPEAFDRDVAPSLYAEIADAIRGEDPDAWIALAPAPTASLGVPTALVAPARPRLLYAPHAYAAAVEMGQPYDAARDAPGAIIRTLAADADRLGLPLVIGELGVRRNIEDAAQYLTDAYAALDATHASAFQWDWGHGDDESYALLDTDGTPTNLAHTIARPYPRRTAGTPHAFTWDPTRGHFTFTWHEPTNARGPTRIVLPRLAFPTGARVRVDRGPWATTDAHEVHIVPRGGARTCELERL